MLYYYIVLMTLGVIFQIIKINNFYKYTIIYRLVNHSISVFHIKNIANNCMD